MARHGRRFPINWALRWRKPLIGTRLYLPSTGTAAVSPAFRAGWEDTTTGSPARRILSPTPTGSAMTTKSVAVSFGAVNTDYLLGQWVSPPLNGAQTISAATIQVAIRGIEGTAGSDAFVTWTIYVVSQDGSTLRGTIQAIGRDNTELATSLTNRWLSATGGAVSAQNGDRIVVELGVGGAPFIDTLSLRIGDVATEDLPFNDSSTSDFNPFVQFSQLLAFGSETTAYTLPADSASWVWTGSAATLKINRVLSANSAGWLWTGSAAALEIDRVLAANAASWVWSGTAASLISARTLSADSASWVWSGTDATLEYLQALTLNAESASWLWTGSAATLKIDRRLAANSASWLWSGTAAQLERDLRLPAESASWLWSGSAITPLVNRLLVAGNASWIWSGTDATLSLGIAPVPPVAVHPWKKAINDEDWRHTGYLQTDWNKALDDSDWVGR